MKHFLTAILTILFANSLFAQGSSSQLKRELATPDPQTGCKVVVIENQDIAGILNKSDYDSKKSVNGYRVMIFFDNKQQARAKADAVISQFRGAYPDIPAYLVYKNPDFKVTVGDCLTSDEAVIIWGRVKSDFPTAVIAHESIPLVQLVKNFE